LRDAGNRARYRVGEASLDIDDGRDEAIAAIARRLRL
jgi:hypothetical protein